MSESEEILEKRQSSQNVCKLVLTGSEPAGKLLCCENNSPCYASPSSCSSSDRLWQCWDIRDFDPCNRNDTVASIACQLRNGVYCLKGLSDYTYNQNSQNLAAINWILSRDTVVYSVNGASTCCFNSCCDDYCSYDGCGGIHYPVQCTDSLDSGSCLITNDAGAQNPFNYQVQVCDNNSYYIIPEPSAIQTTVVTLTAETQTVTFTPEITVTAPTQTTTLTSS
ncbi:14369_t:CDS:1, partial [Acaulospora colombiana]